MSTLRPIPPLHFCFLYCAYFERFSFVEKRGFFSPFSSFPIFWRKRGGARANDEERQGVESPPLYAWNYEGGRGRVEEKSEGSATPELP